MSEHNGEPVSTEQPVSEQPSGEHSHGEHSGSGSHHHHKHHKRKIKIPKNALIIAAAVIALLGLFILMIRYFDQQDAEQPQLLSETAAVTDAGTPAPGAEAAPAEPAVLPMAQPSVRWCALGDSITYGMYSTPEGTSSVTERENIGWAYKAAEANRWDLTNLAVSGEGYLVPGADGSAGYLQARAADFTPYNLVTISLGINDWLSGCPMGTMEDDPAAETITAFIPAMRATLEAVAQSNPLCKIVVLLPMNVKGFTQDFGSRETNWAMGYAMENAGTLKQFTDTMKEICEAYGVEYVDLASASCLNSVSLPELLRDGVHPTAEAHSLLARELAAKILFK